MNKEIFRKLGLTNYECEIYLALVSNGPLSVYDIAKKTGLYRQACYDTLNRLLEKAFVSFSVRKGKKVFQAVDPHKILGYLEAQKQEFDAILPELLNLQNLGKEDISVEVFKGKSTVRIALKDIITTLKKRGGEILCTAVDERVAIDTDKTTIEQYERDILQHRIKERVILKEGTKGFLKKGNTKYAFIKEKYFNPNPVMIYGDKVEILMWGNPNYLVLISSRNIADSFRKQFELMWKMARKR